MRAKLCPTLCDPMNYRALQSPLSTRCSRQEYWSGCHALLQAIFLTQGSSPRLSRLLHSQVGSSPLEPPGKPWMDKHGTSRSAAVSKWQVDGRGAKKKNNKKTKKRKKVQTTTTASWKSVLPLRLVSSAFEACWGLCSKSLNYVKVRKTHA